MKKGIILAVILTLSIIIPNIKVKADSYYRKWDTQFYDDANLTTMWSGGGTFFYKTLYTDNSQPSNLQLFQNYSSNKIDFNAIKGGHITIPFIIDFPVTTGSSGTSSTIIWETCIRWTQQANGTYACTNYNQESNTINTYDYEYIKPVVQMNVMVRYTSGYNDVCEINYDTNYISCPIVNSTGLTFDGLIIAIKVSSNVATNYRLGIGDKINGWTNDSQSIINNQNQNTQTILDTNTTYDTNSTAYTNETTTINDMEQAQDQLMDSLDFSVMDDLNITVNPNASTFIWDIANRLRNMNGAIVLLITSMLSMGIIKMVLNR